MGASDTVIEATGLVKRYGRRAAVDGVDLEVKAGEIEPGAGSRFLDVARGPYHAGEYSPWTIAQLPCSRC